jgi:hypothetical protein
MRLSGCRVAVPDRSYQSVVDDDQAAIVVLLSRTAPEVGQEGDFVEPRRGEVLGRDDKGARK